MKVPTWSDIYFILWEWSDNVNSCVKTILFDGILFNTNLNIFSLGIPVSDHNAFSLFFCIVGFFFIWRDLFVRRWRWYNLFWRSFIKVSEFNNRQIRTLDCFLFLIIIHTLQRLVINNNLQRNKQVTIKLQQSYIFYWRQGQSFWTDIL